MASLALHLCAAGSPAAAQDVGPVFDVERLSEGVYAAIVVPRPDAYAFANSLVVLGEDGVLVVDTQQSPRAAEALIREIEALTDLPVRWVVNTHWHADHVYGNVAYRDRWPGVELLATPETLEGMRGPGRASRAEELADLPGTLRERERWLREGTLPNGQALDAGLREQVEYSLRMRRLYYEELRTLEVVPPNRLVDARTVLDLGGRSATLLPVGPAHTRGDLVVFLEDERILAAGDVLEQGLPWIDGADLAGWASALDALQALDPVTILPAHATEVVGPRFLEQETALFHDVVDASITRPGDGDPVERVIERVRAHAAFLEGQGVSAEALEGWAREAALRPTSAHE